MATKFLIVAGHPSLLTIEFADTLAQAVSDEVLIVSDTPLDVMPTYARAIYITDEEAQASRFINSSPLIAKTPIAWDKALLLLSRGDIDCEYTWIVEDDVFFTSPDVARKLIERYRRSKADLLIPEFFRARQKKRWPWWHLAEHFEDQHRAGGFMPIGRYSRRFLHLCEDFVRKHGSLCFIETMFPSLAVEHALNVEKLDFITRRRFRYRPPFGYWELISKAGPTLRSGIFHPVKSNSPRLSGSVRRFALGRSDAWGVGLGFVGLALDLVIFCRALLEFSRRHLRLVRPPTRSGPLANSDVGRRQGSR